MLFYSRFSASLVVRYLFSLFFFHFKERRKKKEDKLEEENVGSNADLDRDRRSMSNHGTCITST